jgi:hypothetical protein
MNWYGILGWIQISLGFDGSPQFLVGLVERHCLYPGHFCLFLFSVKVWSLAASLDLKLYVE